MYVTTYQWYAVRKERKGYSLWIVSTLTGDRKDCLGDFRDRRAAVRAGQRWARLNGWVV